MEARSGLRGPGTAASRSAPDGGSGVRGPASRGPADEVAGVVLASRHLAWLLSARADYRYLWQARMTRRSVEDVHRGAVAQVLAEHLWDSGEVPETDGDLPRRLKDLVGRALGGQVLAPTTLRLFIASFAMVPHDGEQLWALLTGRDPARLSVVRQDLELVCEPAPVRPAHQTVALHEFHTVGADGLPVSHRTVHLVRAAEMMDRYPYVFDTDAAVVEVLRGGQAGPVYRLPEHELFAVDIVLTVPLGTGETGSLEYLTLFGYRAPPPREFRRGTRQRLDNVEVHVQFHPGRLPARVRWAVWEDHTHRRPMRSEPVQLRPDGSVHRYLDSLSGHTVGFQWDWQ